MQKVASKLPSWDKTKEGGKKGFDKVWGWADKLGAPVNRLTNKIGSEAFWPTTLDKECDKAARILRSFCKDGFYTQEDRPLNQEGPAANTKQRVLKKIPQKVIQNAVGLAVFTTMRTGLWISGAGGSGVLIARMENGEWSPPSGILLHTAGLGFMVGVDIYDCVLVINNRKALEAFKRVRATLGGEVSVVAGPVGVGGVLENDGKWKEANRPVFTYLKSRGFYAGVQVDGTLVIERSDENERFYGQKIGVSDILAGKARHPPHEIKMLMETVKAAEGRSNVDRELMEELEDQPAPGDVDVEAPTSEAGHIFGVPEPDDPDPFGVIALEKAGLEIREAGTKSRPPSSQFEYKPSPTSPVYSHFYRRSVDTLASGSNRGSYTSLKRTSLDRVVQTAEAATQTSEEDLATLPTRPNLRVSRSIVEEEEAETPEDVDYTKVDLGPYRSMHGGGMDYYGGDSAVTSRLHQFDSGPVHHNGVSDHSGTDTEQGGAEEPVVYEAGKAKPTLTEQTTWSQPLGNPIQNPKRGPPPLPPRNPSWTNGHSTPIAAAESGVPPLASPTGNAFKEVDQDRGSQKSMSSMRSDRVESLSALGIVVQDVEEKKTGVDSRDGSGQETANAIPEAAYSAVVIDKENETGAGTTNVADTLEAREVQEEAAPQKPVVIAPAGEDEESDDFRPLPATPNAAVHQP